jgi:hypothetical protein
MRQLVSALLFYYLGGVTLATAFAVGFGNSGLDALVSAAQWPYYVGLFLVELYSA